MLLDAKKVKIQQLPSPQNFDPENHPVRLILRESSHFQCLTLSNTASKQESKVKSPDDSWLAIQPIRDHRTSFFSASVWFMKLHWGVDITSPLQSKEILGPSEGEEASGLNE